jgi:hypothetical protein
LFDTAKIVPAAGRDIRTAASLENAEQTACLPPNGQARPAPPSGKKLPYKNVASQSGTNIFLQNSMLYLARLLPRRPGGATVTANGG